MKLVRVVMIGTVLLGTAVLAREPDHALAAVRSASHATAAQFPCPAGVSPTRATIKRVNLMGNDLNAFPPFHRQVKNASLVQQLFHATCQLQPVSGVYHCPADFGIAYHVTFKQNGVAVLRVVANASGCTWLRQVGGHNPHAYWIWFGPSTSPPMPWMVAAIRWTSLLGKALGLSMAELTPQP